MKTFKIAIFRHGLTEANIAGRYIGTTDLPLCDEGKAQLYELKEKYEFPRAEAFFSSPLLRCTQTLKILYPEAHPILIEGLREYDFGGFEGRDAGELKDDPVFASFLRGEPGTRLPFGEDIGLFERRVCGAFEKIAEGLLKTGIQSAAICTHGGVIMTVMARYGLPQLPVSQWRVPHGGGYTLRITPSVWARGKKAEVISTI